VAAAQRIDRRPISVSVYAEQLTLPRP